MAAHDVNQATDKGYKCFLCALNQSSCHEAQLEGRVVAVQERTSNGAKIPIIVLDTGTSRVEVQLEHHYYQKLIKELKACASTIDNKQNLTLRIHHLPSAPQILEHNGEVKRRLYKGNSYTLAILEPDMLLNITDLNQAEYCPRQYTLNRLAPSPASPATIRGNIVHYCFKELLKAYDREHFASQQTPDGENSPRDQLYHHLEQALQLYNIDIALANVPAETMRQEITPHLDNLAQWFSKESTTLWDMPEAYNEQAEHGRDNQVRAETFLLAPEIGLRGRLDLFWQQANGRQRLLELKTGGAKGQLPRHEHRLQVNGYHALLAVRHDSKMQKAMATLLYSGTPEGAQDFGIPSNIRDIQRVNEKRNLLVLSRVTGKVADPPGPGRCTKCAVLDQCQRVSTLLSWQPPAPDPDAMAERQALKAYQAGEDVPQPEQIADTAEDQQFFAAYYDLLQQEGKAGEQQQALLWKTPVAERIELGTAIGNLEPLEKPVVSKDGWEQTFRCNNTSELREGDEILLSDGNPISGEVVTGTISAINSEQITIWARELILHPVLVDRYDNDLVHVRTLQNLLRWLQTEQHLRQLVARQITPRFNNTPVPPRPDFNAEQNLAVERALQMEDYLLIQGPPGTGKTSVIAEIVKRLAEQGQRVLLAAFTNQAVDNMLKRLDKEDFHNYVRLGHERSVDYRIHDRLFKNVIERNIGNQDETRDMSTLVRDILRKTPVVASTTATWSSDKYAPQLRATPQEDHGLHFDVAVIDEAGQLTIPAILGALRFAKRFILVGDEQQLPPLVLSREAAIAGLSTSLFGDLKQFATTIQAEQPAAINPCVPLRVQYRMNKWISNFSSTVFYNRELIAHKSIEHQILAFKPDRQRLNCLQEDEPLVNALNPAWPLTFLDVSTRPQANVTLTTLQEPKSNNLEAETVRELVAALLARGIKEKDIGIIAPYRAQVANIRRHLFKHLPEQGWQALPVDTPLMVDTVDRFQGGERSVIIISFATSIEPAVGNPRRDFLTNMHRLNVALTRAQRKLILVGHASALENLPTFNRLLTYCRSMKTLFTWPTIESYGELSSVVQANNALP